MITDNREFAATQPVAEQGKKEHPCFPIMMIALAILAVGIGIGAWLW